MYRFTTAFSIFSTLLGSSLVLNGCTTSTTRPEPIETTAEATEAQQPKILNSVITTVSEANGQILVEIPVGRDHHITPGTLLRVLDGERDGYLKGMLQVLTVAEAELSLARQIGLMDRQNPIAVGDPVVVIYDVSELAQESTESVNDSIAKERAATNEEEADEQEQFKQLRINYTTELKRLQAEHSKQLAQVEQLYQTQISELEANHQRHLTRKEAEHLTELSAVRQALADEAVTGLRLEREARAAEIKRLTAENAKLLQQVESFAGGIEQSAAMVRKHENAISSLRENHQREILAELETREILEQRIRELEVRLGLPGSKAPAVLVGDVGRQETVLARLDRISRERNELLREISTVREQLEQYEAAANPDGGGPIDIKALQLNRQQLAEELGRAQTRLGALRDRLQGIELARLQAERSFYALAEQALRLPSSSPSVQNLQKQLRQQLTTIAEGSGGQQ